MAQIEGEVRTHPQQQLPPPRDFAPPALSPPLDRHLRQPRRDLTRSRQDVRRQFRQLGELETVVCERGGAIGEAVVEGE
jgi:hypothetical protein